MDIIGLWCYVTVLSVLLLFCLIPVADRIREIELSIAVGHEAENIMTMFKDIEEKETLEDTNMLKKLQKILTPGRKNQTFSSSSSESFSGEASRSSMSQSSSSSESSESSSSSSSTESGRQILVSGSSKCATMKSQKVWERIFMCSLMCLQPETDTINFIPNQVCVGSFVGMAVVAQPLHSV